VAKKFDASRLAWSPSTNAEREKFRRRQPWFTFWPQLDDAEAEALLQEILALRRKRLNSKTGGENEEIKALTLTAKLAEGAARMGCDATDAAVARRRIFPP
jgi:hypothetical protein